MQNLLLIGTFESLTFAILLFFIKRNRVVSDALLALFFLILALTMFLVWMDDFNREHHFKYPIFLFTASPLLLLHGPALWFYIKSLTKQHFVFKKLYLLHLLPFMAMVIHHAIVFYSLPVGQKVELAISEDFMNCISFPVFLTMIVISPFAYFIWGLILLKRYNNQLKNYFSKVNDIDLKWLKTLLWVSILFYAVTNIAFVFLTSVVSFHDMQLLSFAFSTFYVLFLGFYGHRQVNLFASFNPVVELESIESPKLVENLTVADDLFVSQLLELMNQEKPFLNPDLYLSGLSSMLNKSPEYISGVLNNQLNLNFYDFINNYRVNEFKKVCRLPENKNFTIIAIAYSCGFNSKATFYRVFKLATGHTPSEYMAMSH